MTQLKIKILTFAAVCTLPVMASAATITFEDIAVGAGVNDIGGDRVSGGFQFDSLTNHTHLTNDAFAVSNGSAPKPRMVWRVSRRASRTLGP